ncbi:MAG: 1-deoxy-D-xylulose-5-phosphate reductoisomerase [Candidatus Makaraimicrobium thalassicum]|nr:MAG: 1-deoxy-D-xylulose-5-phosphate reductoisomerase [Candidatus Omnitrophota bacterium]
MKDIILFGSTGSVGRNVLDVVRHYPGRFRVRAISSNENVSLLVEQAEEFKPAVVAIGNERFYPGLKDRVAGPRVYSGAESLERLAAEEPADIVFMAISGTQALKPLVTALNRGRTVALASKEPVVSAGMIIKRLTEENSSRILPVDSEHSAVMQCLAGRSSEDVRTLYITGSGGPLRDRKREEFDSLSIDQILDHPKWDMGRKITVDSATLMNKGLEVIEARWLFDVPPERIKVVIHPEAIIHSMVEFIDGTISAGLFRPDMRFPILRALSFPAVIESDFPRVNFSVINGLSFSEPDTDRFPALEAAFEALRAGGTMPAVLNGSNEAAVKLFLEEKIRFTDIGRIVKKVVEKHSKVNDPSLEDIIASEKWSAEEVLRYC